MRFIGKWLIWIGGLALLYVDLRPLGEEAYRAYQSRQALGPYTLEEWLLRFARPVFVLGVLCAAALPDLGARRARKKSKAVPSVPGITTAAAPPPPAAPPPSAPPPAL